MMTEKASAGVRLDFQGDFRIITEQALARMGAALDPVDAANAVYLLFANARRRIEARPYRVDEANDLVCPAHLAAGYAELKSELERGIDVIGRLSRTTKDDAAYEDMMFNDWGVQHFHLGIRDLQGNVPRTDPILFAVVRDDVVHCIGFFEHRARAWAKIQVLESLQRNWPYLMEHARYKGGMASQNYSDEERARLRKLGGNVSNTINGVVYGAVGGGYTAAKTSMAAHWEADRAIIAVSDYEKHVRENVAAYVKQIEDLGRIAGTPPRFRFWVNEDGNACAMELTAEVNFILGPFRR